MIFLTNTVPSFCPNCRADLAQAHRDALSRQDFFAGCACTCECGANYAYVEGPKLVTLAGENGDMMQYVSPEDEK